MLDFTQNSEICIKSLFSSMQTLIETANLVLRHLDQDDRDDAQDSDGVKDPEAAAVKSFSSSPCTTEPNAQRYILVLRLLERFGGVFIPEDAILVDFPIHLRAASFVSGVIARGVSQFADGIVVAKRNGFIAPSSSAGLLVVLASGRSSAHGTALQPCGSIRHYNHDEDGDCICVKVEHEIFPADVWRNTDGAQAVFRNENIGGGEDKANDFVQELGSPDSSFATLARLAGYGTRDIQLRYSSRSTVPRIAHYICWDCDLKFETYLSVISSLYVAGLSKVRKSDLIALKFYKRHFDSNRDYKVWKERIRSNWKLAIVGKAPFHSLSIKTPLYYMTINRSHENKG